jgi:hypothetical protein
LYIEPVGLVIHQPVFEVPPFEANLGITVEEFEPTAMVVFVTPDTDTSFEDELEPFTNLASNVPRSIAGVPAPTTVLTYEEIGVIVTLWSPPQ